MNTEIITPKNEPHWLELRTNDITSTDVSALFNISPYLTHFELWHRKKNKTVVELEPSEVMKWGQRLQDAIAHGVAEDNGWEIRRMAEYIRIPELRIGSSFDYELFPLEYNPKDVNFTELGILEIKNVFGLIFKDQWLEDEGGNIEAPPHIEIQVQHQLLVSDRAFAYIATLVSGNKVVLLKREPNPSIQQAIKTKCAEFWASIDSGEEPKPDFSQDAEFIGKLMNYAEPGKVVDFRSDTSFQEKCEEHKRLGDIEKDAKTKRDAIKAELLTKIGDAEKVLGDGFSITAGLIAPAHISYDRDGYRMFRINWPRGKK